MRGRGKMSVKLAAIIALMALAAPARAGWLVDYVVTPDPAYPSISAIHVQFTEPTLLTADATTTLSLATTSHSTPITGFAYDLAIYGICTPPPGSIGIGTSTAGCAAVSFAPSAGGAVGQWAFILPTADPLVYEDGAPGTPGSAVLTFSLNAVPEPATLALLALGIGATGLTRRARRG